MDIKIGVHFALLLNIFLSFLESYVTTQFRALCPFKLLLKKKILLKSWTWSWKLKVQRSKYSWKILLRIVCWKGVGASDAVATPPTTHHPPATTTTFQLHITVCVCVGFSCNLQPATESPVFQWTVGSPKTKTAKLWNCQTAIVQRVGGRSVLHLILTVDATMCCTLTPHHTLSFKMDQEFNYSDCGGATEGEWKCQLVSQHNQKPQLPRHQPKLPHLLSLHSLKSYLNRN